MSERGLLLIVSAPSGTGKTTICRQVLKAFPHLDFSVSYTTRPRRPGEEDGRDYHFISEEEFKTRIERGEFIEWVINYDHYYGTSGKDLEEKLSRGRDVMLDVEFRGAQAIKEHYPDGVFVFILPPDLRELRSRLGKRGFESPEVIERRFNQALDEIKSIFWYDYVIFNDRLDEAVETLKAIYRAEKSRRSRLEARIKDFLTRQGG
ncbi:MAG TPA: guanylate kinase [Syntrophales bacterium]|nr:guanylate kinase [Syntrophales bacterium]HOL58913.1 guanylate kinase [Syntrophales bacterium]HPO35240.1 guanylate kinase [Syntrophales bacterium]